MSNTLVTFSQMRKTPENTRARDTGKSQTQKKSPQLPTTFDSYCQEKGHKLVQEVIHAARLAGPQHPLRSTLAGASGAVGRSGTSGDRGHLNPSRSPAATPSNETFGWVPERKIWCCLSQREGVRVARYRPRNAQSGDLDATRARCQCRSGLHRLRRPAL